MSAIDILRAALFGDPPSASFKPSREGTLAAFEALVREVSGTANGLLRYDTKLALDADVSRDDGQLAYVFDDPTPANNTVYQWDDPGNAWEVASWYFDALAAIVEPILDDAQEALDTANAAALANARYSMYPDRFFQLSGGNLNYDDGGGPVYWANNVDGTWDADFEHAYGKGAWEHTATGGFKGFSWYFANEPSIEAGIGVGDVVSVGAMVKGSTAGQVIRFQGYFFAGTPLTQVGATINFDIITADETEQVANAENLTIPATATGMLIYTWATAPLHIYHILDLWIIKGEIAGVVPPQQLSLAVQNRFLMKLDNFVSAKDRIDWVVQYGASWNAEDQTLVGSDLTGTGFVARTNVFTGFGFAGIAAPSDPVNLFNLAGLRQATGGDAGGTQPFVPWCKLRVYARTGAAGAADDAAATIIAYGEKPLDPDKTEYTADELWIAMRDWASRTTNDSGLGDLLTIDPGDWDDDVGIFYQVLDENDDPASVDQTAGTRDDLPATKRSFYATTQQASTGAWTAFTPSSDLAPIGIRLGFVADIEDDFIPSDALLERLENADAVATEVTNARGDMASVDERLSVALSDVGTPKVLIHAPERLRVTRNKLRLRERASAATLEFAFIGDSWTNNEAYFINMVATILAAAYGDAGPGWIGFGINGATINGNARSIYSVAKTGVWSSDFGTADSPDASNAKSSAAGAKLTITAGVGATAVLSAMTLFWQGTADGVVRYRWDGGAWTALNVQGAGFQSANLGSLPAGGTWVLEIEVVSGSVNLMGVNGKSAASGIRIHKLGASGRMASSFEALTAATWQAEIAALALDAAVVMFGTNESANDVPPASFGLSLDTVLDRLRTARPAIDLTVMMPPENDGGNMYAMPLYANEGAKQAEAHDAAFINLQYAFGPDVDGYKDGSSRPWLVADGYHPVDAVTVPIIADTVVRSIQP